MTGIYEIINTQNSMRYIGQSIDINGRFSDHKSALRNNRHPNRHLQNAWNLYGQDCFEFKIQEECTTDELDEKERFYINAYSTTDRKYGYNFEDGGSVNKHVSDETKIKISQKLMGHPVSEATIEKMRLASTGRHLSDEAKRKVSESSLGRKMSDEARRKLSESRRGFKMSEEQKKKLSQILTGRKWSEEQKANVRGKRSGKNNPMYGKHLSEETRKKLSESHKGRTPWNKGVHASEEQKRKQSIAMKGRPSNRSRNVMDLTTGIIYPSVAEAQRQTGFKHIDGCARGERNFAGGHKWVYI